MMLAAVLLAMAWVAHHATQIHSQKLHGKASVSKNVLDRYCHRCQRHVVNSSSCMILWTSCNVAHMGRGKDLTISGDHQH